MNYTLDKSDILVKKDEVGMHHKADKMAIAEEIDEKMDDEAFDSAVVHGSKHPFSKQILSNFYHF